MSEWHWSKFFCAVRENQQRGVKQKNETLQVKLSLEPKETSTYAEMQVNCWRMEKVFGAELQRVSVWHLAQRKEACGLQSSDLVSGTAPWNNVPMRLPCRKETQLWSFCPLCDTEWE